MVTNTPTTTGGANVAANVPQSPNRRSLWGYRLLLISAAAVWGLGFTVGKGAIAEVGATWFTAIRFLGAALVLGIIFHRQLRAHLSRKLVRAGAIMGTASFLGFWTQFLGLGMTTPSKNAFLSACYCVTVPFVWWIVARRRPSARTLLAALVCVVGVGLVSLDGGLSIGPGDAMSIVSAFVYGAEIVVIALVMRDNDVMAVTVVQQLTAGLLALVLAALTHPAPTLVQMAHPGFVGAMLYVILGSAAFGAVAQNKAQSQLSAAESGLLCSLESVFCALFGVTFFGEAFTPRMLAGFALIFTAVVISQTEPQSESDPPADEA